MVSTDIIHNTSSTRAPQELNIDENQMNTINNIQQWIIDQNVDNKISEMATVIMTYKPGIINDAEIFTSSNDQIKSNVMRGYAILNQLIAVGEFSDDNLDTEKVQNYIDQIKNKGFNQTLQDATESLKFQGSSADELKHLTSQYKHGDKLMDILHHGQRSLMKSNFRPNGYVGYRQSSSYHNYRAVCNHHMFELLNQGKAVIIPMSIIPTSTLEKSHGSKLELVQSSKKEGRCCLNAGSKCRKFMSLNDGTDRELCLTKYPKEKLPTIQDICELAEYKRQICEPIGDLVVGATIDVADAYRQYTLSAEATLHRSVMIYIGIEMIPYVVYPLVGWYGDAIAGDVYNIVGGFISWYHNNYDSVGINKATTTNNKNISNAMTIQCNNSINSKANKFNMAINNMTTNNMTINNMAANNMATINMTTNNMAANNMATNNMATDNIAINIMAINNMAINNMASNNVAINNMTINNNKTTSVSNDVKSSNAELLNQTRAPISDTSNESASKRQRISQNFNNELLAPNDSEMISVSRFGSKHLSNNENITSDVKSRSVSPISPATSGSVNHPPVLLNPTEFDISACKKSITYIDDGIILESDKFIDRSRAEYREGVTCSFGSKAIAPKKDKFWGQDLEAIGWHLNTRYEVWRVAPKQKGLDKIYASLFIRLPSNVCDEEVKIFVVRRVLHEIASLLSWYAVVLRVGNPFVRSLFKNCGFGPDHIEVEIDVNCKRDLAWWKLISHASMSNPHILSASISHLRRNIVADEVLFTDASTSIGGGGWLANSVNDISGSRMEGFIRWSPEEMSAFESGINGKIIDINVLEFFVVIYFVLIWGQELKGKVVNIKCDNTAAICWLLKMRASNKSPVAETLIKVFALYCVAMDITLLPSHIPGILNIRADYLSRDIDLQESNEKFTNLKDKIWWKELSRPEICRQLLMASIIRPQTVPSQLILELLKALQ